MSKKCPYLIFCGLNFRSIVNSLWASIDKQEIIPSKIILLFSNKEVIEKTKKCIETLIEKFLGNSCPIISLMISEWDIKENISKLLNYFGNEKTEKNFIIDITPSRKTMSISGVLFVNKVLKYRENLNEELLIHHVIYWHLIESEKYQRKWYPEIPRENFNFIDLKDVVS